VKASDIPDKAILDVIDAMPVTQYGYKRWALVRDLEAVLPEYPRKVILAKCRSLIKRKIIDGCTCGCRGDFERVPKNTVSQGG
jgi:hypothetical protein